MNLNNKNKSCKGRVFIYLHKWDGRITKRKKAGRGQYQSKPIMNMNTGIVYNSYKEAAEKLGLNVGSLRVNMHNNRPLKGYWFCYV